MIGTKLSGKKVNLRPLDDADLTRRTRWLNDLETVQLFTGSEPARVYEREDAERWRQNLEADPTSIVWALETKDGWHIGDVDLHSIDRYERAAKLTILIGDKNYWNSGYGTDSVETLLRHAFTTQGLEAVDLRVYDFNERAIRCYEKCGFERIESPPSAMWATQETGEVYMRATKKRFLAENPDAFPLRA